MTVQPGHSRFIRGVSAGVAAFLLLVVGCSGDIAAPNSESSGGSKGTGNKGSGGSGQTGPDAPAEAAFTCDEDSVPGETPLRRLTKQQYVNTLHDVLTFALQGRAAADEAMKTIENSLSGFPDSQRPVIPEDQHGTYRRIDQIVPQNLVDASYDVAMTVGAILSNRDNVEKAVGACVTDGTTANDATCVQDFIQRFGERVLRRPLSGVEVTEFRAVYGTPASYDALALKDVIAVMLSTPPFLYHVEHGDKEVGGKTDVAYLSAFELASRLSYQFWNTMPDEELWAAAKSNALLDEDTLRDQVDRLLNDPRAELAADDFFREWFKLEEIPALDAKNTDLRFKAFAADSLPTRDLRQAVVDEAMDMVRYYTWDQPAGIDALLASDLAFPRTQELADIYESPIWDAQGEPVQLSAEDRPGFLTRAWNLSTGSVSTRLIMRGVFIRKHVLCDEIPPPPDDAGALPPPVEPDATGRQVVENITEKVGGSCSACHKPLINPIGFALEGFDALGRLRTEERLLSDTGAELGIVPVDTTSVPRITASDATPSSGAADLVGLIRESGKPQRCLAQNYLRYSFARWDNLETDGCALERMRLAAHNGSLKDVLRDVAFTDSFQQKSFR